MLQCFLVQWIANTYFPQLYADPFIGIPYLLMDPATATLPLGSQFSITCYVVGIINQLSPLLIEVVRGDEVFLRAFLDNGARYKQFYVQEAGRYLCQLMINGSVISRATTTIVPGVNKIKC